MTPSTTDASRRTVAAGARRADRSATSLPTMIPIRAFRTPVRGHAFASPPPGGERPVPGLPAELTREPDNPADPLAVAVWTAPVGGARWRIGYLDRGVAARVAPRLDAGVRVRAQLDGWSTEPEGRWRRPLLLLLPEDVPEADPDVALDDVAPDDVAPDDVAPEDLALRKVAPEDVAPMTEAVAGRPDASPRIWGRPPGVRRRRVS